ncbi:MAG: rRNA maturation RNase YbeY [Acidimicrobiales bacterium]|jgi:probable rRNA maturation factor
MGVDVFVADEQQNASVDLGRFGDLAKRVLEAQSLKGEVEVSLLFVDEDSMAELNERFLGEVGPTDVLAFPIEDEPEPGGRSPDEGGTGPGGPTEPDEIPLLLGDVVVCPSVAERNAAERGVGLVAEVELLVVHGLLHLLGMDHEEDEEAQQMERRQSDLLARFGSSGNPE